MSHIPAEKLLPQDLVDVFDHGPAEEPHAAPIRIRMHASDAKHAMDVEPERYTLDAEKMVEFVEEPKEEPAKEEE